MKILFYHNVIKNNFVQGDSNEIIEEIDNKIMAADSKRLDYSLENGLEGLLHCILSRICGAIKQNNPIPFDKQYLQDINHSICLIKADRISPNLNRLINLYYNFMSTKKCEYNLCVRQFIVPITNGLSKNNIQNFDFGLKKGWQVLYLVKYYDIYYK